MASVYRYALLCVFCVRQCSGLGNKAVFSVKTGYDWVYSSNPRVSNSSDTTITFRGATCSAIHVNALVRHGARLPTAEKMDHMSVLRTNLLRSKPVDASGALETWPDDFDPSQEWALVPVGMDEQFDLGVRYSHRFSDLFNNGLKDLEMISSSKSRNIKSAKAFYDGMASLLTGENANREDQDAFEPAVNDALTRFFDNCDRYDATIQSVYKEVDDFQGRPKFVKVKEGISSRLGVTNYTLTAVWAIPLPGNGYFAEEKNNGANIIASEEMAPSGAISSGATSMLFANDDVNILYEMCANDLLINGRDNLCRLMTDEERTIVEDEYDIKFFYQYSSGNNISDKAACVVVKNMFTGMDDVINRHSNNNSFNVGSFKFGHVPTMLGTYAALGLFNDNVPLLANNIETMTRKFRTSLTTPMSANVAFVLYHCPPTGSQTQQYAVKAFVNEEPVDIPACGEPVCSYDDVRNQYNDQMKNCDRDGVCSYDISCSTRTGTHALYLVLTVTIAAFKLSALICRV